MALYQAATPPAQKLIFAPSGSSTDAQAPQFTLDSLERAQLAPSPLHQFSEWFSLAQSEHVPSPETVCLSTAHLPSGRITSRYVYLKELDTRGFVVYSNWGTSQKAKDVASNPRAALAFWWREQERQVRVEGRVERLSPEESQVYYSTRARGSQIGAWASRQSQAIEGREVLEGWVKEAEERFTNTEKIPVPEFWGGIRVVPDRVEFWQGRESRLHDRFEYVRREDAKEGEEEWEIRRLSP